VLSVILGSTGQVLIKQGVKDDIIASLTSLPLWAGLFLYGVAFLTWLKFLIRTPLSQAYPVLSLNFILITILSTIILKEPINYKIICGYSFMKEGLGLRFYYNLTFYLNGEHWITHPEGNRGETHPHSWEISIKFARKNEDDQQFEFFTELENLIKNYLAIFEGQLINEVPPFDTINATLENMAKVFYKQIRNILDKNGFILVRLALSESPNRCVEMEAIDDYERIKHDIQNRIEKDIISIASFREKRNKGQERSFNKGLESSFGKGQESSFGKGQKGIWRLKSGGNILNFSF